MPVGHHGSMPSGELVAELVDDREQASCGGLADRERQPEVCDGEFGYGALYLRCDHHVVVIIAPDRGGRTLGEVCMKPEYVQDGSHGGNVVVVRVTKDDNIVRV